MLNHKHPELKHAKYFVFVDSSRRYVDCSDGVFELLGYTRDEMLQKAIDDISYDVSQVPNLFRQYLETGSQQGEYVLQRKDRTPLPIRYQAFVFQDGCNAAIWEPIQDWRQPYMAALLELDPAKQRNRIEQALAAIQQKREAVNPSSFDQQVMSDAISMLNTLRKNFKY